MNLWPKDREALSFTQRDLNLLNHKDLEDQLERKPTGKIVPYLLVCATLQPALFAGGQTQAATFLRLSSPHFAAITRHGTPSRQSSLAPGSWPN